MKYRGGYKYQLLGDEVFKTAILGYDIDTSFMRLESDGTLTVKYGYAWDGASGPAIDTEDIMRASLAHDAKYQLMREGFIPVSMRKQADIELLEDCLREGMPRLRAMYIYRGVRIFGGGFVNA